VEEQVTVTGNADGVERMLVEARKAAEEREVALKRVQRRNRKAAGLG